MVYTTFILLLTLLSSPLSTSTVISDASTYTSGFPHPPNGHCTDYTVHQHLTTDNYVYSFPPFTSNFDVATFLFNLTRKDSTTAYQPLAGITKLTKDYVAEGTFCTPKIKVGSGKEKVVLLATHGATFDRRYWASSFEPEQYSFVAHALDSGYSIFYYDRLGTGKSPIISGYENQDSNQIAFLGALAKAIRNGSYTSDIIPSKVILLGHSFGSYISNVLLTVDPSAADGAIMTGFSYPNSTDASRFSVGSVLSAFPIRLSSEPQDITRTHGTDSGNFFIDSLYGFAQTFFHAPYYSTRALEYAYSTTGRLSVGECLTFGRSDLHAPGFKGPVLVTTAEYDILVCGGECKSTYEGGLQRAVWSGASVLETYLHPGVGHVLNFEKDAKGFYEIIIRFLDKHFD